MKKKRIIRRLFILLLTVLGAFGFYVSDYYTAEPTVVETFIDSGKVEQEKGFYALEVEDKDLGIVFYPGGKVEAAAYIPLAEKLREQNINVFIAEMPFNLAVFNSGAATNIMAANEDIDHWFIMGHSLGGAMASDYFAKHPDKIEGAILLASYIYGGADQDKVKVLYGSEDGVLNRDKIKDGDNVTVINGGNHGGFGNYGPQSGDGMSSISNEEQQDLTVQETLTFIKHILGVKE